MKKEHIEIESQVSIRGTHAQVSKGSVILDALDRTFKYWALAPAVILLLFLTVLPVINLLRLAVSEIDFVKGKVVWKFVGLENIYTLLQDWLFRTAIVNTFFFVLLAVSIEVVLGFFLAMLVSRVTKGTRIYRTIMILPILIPAVAIGSMWRLLYNSDFGLINRVIMAFGSLPIPFLASTKYAMMSVILVDIWHWTPFVFLICLAGFQSLPIDILEAASVDGAGRWVMLRSIILPLMWSTLSVVLMFRTIFAFKVFDEIILLTAGGPGTSTEVVSLYIHKVYFQQFRLGYGALISLVTILIIAAVLVMFRLMRPKEVT
jgi:multiple sugar transport system permease protein